METASDRAGFLADFGQDAVIGAATIRGVFDNAHEGLLSGFESMGAVSTTGPRLLCRSADVAAVAMGDGLATGGKDFTVVDVQPDGTGMTLLILQEAG